MVRRSGARSWVVSVVSGLVVLVVSAGVAGCGGEPEPRFAPAPSASAPVTSPSSGTTDATPSSAPGAATPEEAIRQWLTLEVEMQNSGATETFRAATARCKRCLGFADRIASYYAAGGYVRTAPESVLSIAEQPSSGRRRVFDVRVDPQPTAYATSSDAPVEQLPGDPLTFRVTVARSDGRWLMFDAVQLAS